MGRRIEAAHLSAADKETLGEIIKNHFKDPGYTDVSVKKMVNGKDLLKLGGGRIATADVTACRKALGLDKRKAGGKRHRGGRRRSLKTREGCVAGIAGKYNINAIFQKAVDEQASNRIAKFKERVLEALEAE